LQESQPDKAFYSLDRWTPIWNTRSLKAIGEVVYHDILWHRDDYGPSILQILSYITIHLVLLVSAILILAQTALLASSESALNFAPVMAAPVHSTRLLHFVTIDASNASPNVAAKQRKSLRAFVMRDYLRQKNDPS
jgi:hypothetical protein